MAKVRLVEDAEEKRFSKGRKGGREGIEEEDEEEIKRMGPCLRPAVDTGGRGRV